MKEQPEALWLVEVMPYLEGGERGQWIIDATAELRRLHEENEALREANETFGKRQEWWNDKMVELEAQRDALLEALKMIAGTAPCIDNLMSDKDIARAAIKAVEGDSHAKGL